MLPITSSTARSTFCPVVKNLTYHGGEVDRDRTRLWWLTGVETISLVDFSFKSLAKLDKTQYSHIRHGIRATDDGRELNSMDLAFLGRLLDRMRVDKLLPQLQPPPFLFPNDFELFHVSLSLN